MHKRALLPLISVVVSPFITFSLLILFWVALTSNRQSTILYAQETAQSQTSTYVVVAGDTLSLIAERFSVELDVLVKLNQIENPALIQVGQVLLIPGRTGGPQRESLTTVAVPARPGESLGTFAQRLSQNVELLSTLNNIRQTQRLFPGQPIDVPATAIEPESLTPLGFGAISQLSIPKTLVQGHTGYVQLASIRPISLTGSWNGLPIAFTNIPILPQNTVTPTVATLRAMNTPQNSQEMFALLPVPALIAPASYPLTVTYMARNNQLLSQTFLVTVHEGAYESQNIVLPEGKGELLADETVRNELEKLIAVWSTSETELFWRGGFVRPIGVEYATTSPYGTRRSYNGGPTASYHSGHDFGAPEGTAIFAPANGVVALAEPLAVRGNAVLMDHGRGIFTGYWHLNEIKVPVGQKIEAGDLIGLVGTTGLSTGAHLHWELRIHGIAVNPMQFLEEPLFQK